jgi:phosphoserine aminotransferase
MFYNLYPGPSKIPLPVLQRLKDSLLEYKNCGVSPLELYHRDKPFTDLYHQVKQKCKEILKIPRGYSLLFMEGGSLLQFYLVPLNLMHFNKKAGYILSGHWSNLAYNEAKRVLKEKASILFNPSPSYNTLCEDKDLQSFLKKDYSYLYLTSNNTVFGTQYKKFPHLGDVPLVIDATSDLGIRNFEWEKDNIGIVFSSCQKNFGLAGLTMIIIRDDLISPLKEEIPNMLSYAYVGEKEIIHTPPVFNFLVLDYMLDYINQKGGVCFFYEKSQKIAKEIYSIIDKYPNLYLSSIDKESRSSINIVFDLPTQELTHEFLKKAHERHLLGVKGHRSKGGIRLSFYNSFELEETQVVCQFLQDFALNSEF